MVEQKGRSGKKPKYQIADIGGTDLTSQDISTERVLNFLIKGEIGSADQSSLASSAEADETVSKNLSANTASSNIPDNLPETSLPSSETRGGKSLAHLFERASSSSARTSKSFPALQEQPISFSQVAESEISLQAKSVLNSQQVTGVVENTEQHLRANDSVRVAPSNNQAEQAPDAPLQKRFTDDLIDPKANKISTANASQQNPNLTELTSLWKTLYRLNAGEMDALSAIYRMSYGQGSPECHIKMPKLAEMSNLTYRYCQKVVRNLEQSGWITKLKDYDPTNQLGVLYSFNLKPTNNLL